jgi:hypothetical protein
VSATHWGVLLAAMTLVVAIPTLILMAVQELRARERADVEWQVERTSQGVFRITNVGEDATRHVTVEMWSRDEIETARAKRLDAGEHLSLELPGRVTRGSDHVEGLPEPYPRDPPASPSLRARSAALRSSSATLNRHKSRSRLSGAHGGGLGRPTSL